MKSDPSLNDLVCISLTLTAYLFGLATSRRLKTPVCNPVLIAILTVAVSLHVLHIPYYEYFRGAQAIHFLLGPATVVLAIPLVQSIDVMRSRLAPLIISLLLGSVVSLLLGPWIVYAFGGPRLLGLSMAPKALTTPIAIGVAHSIGGDAGLCAVLAILSGVLVAVVIDPLLKFVRITDAASIGLSAGASGSGIGAAHVIPTHPTSAAFAGVAIGLNGLITAILAPVLVHLLP